jgi:hypothetical protein
MSKLVRTVFVGLTRPQNKKAAVTAANNCVAKSQMAEQALSLMLQVGGPAQSQDTLQDAAYPIFSPNI